MCFNMSLVTDRLALEGEFGAVFEQFPSYSGGSTPSIEYYNRSGFSHPCGRWSRCRIPGSSPVRTGGWSPPGSKTGRVPCVCRT